MTSPNPDATRIGRLMCLALRHAPEEVGLAVDGRGWARVSDMLRVVRAKGYEINGEGLLAIVAGDDKQRYALTPDCQRIRCQQGHSFPVDLGLEEAMPPARLYHGTVATALDAIFREGLRPMSRQHVHLSPSVETATAVGDRRRGTTLILEVDAAAMAQGGERFLVSGNGVWLTSAVAPRFLRLLGAPDQATLPSGETS